MSSGDCWIGALPVAGSILRGSPAVMSMSTHYGPPLSRKEFGTRGKRMRHTVQYVVSIGRVNLRTPSILQPRFKNTQQHHVAHFSTSRYRGVPTVHMRGHQALRVHLECHCLLLWVKRFQARPGPLRCVCFRGSLATNVHISCFRKRGLVDQGFIHPHFFLLLECIAVGFEGWRNLAGYLCKRLFRTQQSR